MKRDELIKLLETFDNLEVEIFIAGRVYKIEERNIFECGRKISITPVN